MKKVLKMMLKSLGGFALEYLATVGVKGWLMQVYYDQAKKPNAITFVKSGAVVSMPMKEVDRTKEA